MVCLTAAHWHDFNMDKKGLGHSNEKESFDNNGNLVCICPDFKRIYVTVPSCPNFVQDNFCYLERLKWLI